jgi:hypothetical protein
MIDVSASPTWVPCRNPVQRLIQFLDVMGIALNRLHIVSLRLPRPERFKRFDTPSFFEKRQHLLEQFDAIRKTILPWDKFGPRTAADRLKRDVEWLKYSVIMQKRMTRVTSRLWRSRIECLAN